MGEISGLLIAVAIGVPLLIGAALLDRHRQRKLEGKLEPPPATDDPQVDEIIPAYITQSEIDAMPSPAGPRTSNPRPGDASFGFGHAAPEFATAGEVCELDDARVLLVEGEIDAMRELITPMATFSPLVVAAEGFHDDVLATLRANRKALNLSVVALSLSTAQLHQLLTAVGGELLTPSDLQAGYVPEQALGHADRWWSTLRETRIGREA